MWHVKCRITTWGDKQHSIYILDENGERIKKKNGRYKTTTEFTTDWNSREKAMEWRKDLAETINATNEKIGNEEAVWDHRSFKERGLDIVPEIHMGAKACALERKGIRTDRGNVNRQIRLQKGAGYERWAKVFNLKQMAQVMCYLQENSLDSIEALQEKTVAATAKFNDLSDSIKTSEKRLAEIAVLKTHIINYSKTREVYTQYRKAGYSRKFFEEHRNEITLHKAAKEAFDALELKKIPKVKDLSVEYAEVLSAKKTAYAEYRDARKEMQECQIALKTVETLLNVEQKQEEKREQEQKKDQEQNR